MSFATSNIWNKEWTVSSMPPPASSTTTAHPYLRSVLGELIKRTSNGESEARLPEALTKEQLMEKYGDKLKELRVTEGDVQNIVNDKAQFRKFQETLRERRVLTHAALKLDLHFLVREQIDDMKKATSTNYVSPVSVKSTVEVQLLERDNNIASPQSVTQFVSIAEYSFPDLTEKSSNLTAGHEKLLVGWH
jgi:hypothetical protein